MSMSKQDFIALADTIRRANEAGTVFSPQHLDVLAAFCAQQNPNFMRERWLAYVAGTGGPGGRRIGSQGPRFSEARQLLDEVLHGGSEEQVAGQATGLFQHPRGIGQFYDRQGNEITPQQAYDIVREGSGAVEVPNAGAGSYRAVFEAMGFTDVEDWETSSSAGDWTLVVHDGEGGFWYPAFQENRHPYHGFRYSINVEMGAPTKEELFQILQSGE